MANNHYPKVTIITCVYNGEKYISKLLDSVLNMDYPNIEHIIVNDGSTDSTESIVMRYSKLYEKKEELNLYIKYIKQENMGLGGATNTGLKQITGEYWTWINCDDWYEKGAFFELVGVLMNKRKLDYIQMNGFNVSADGEISKIVSDNYRFNKVASNKYRLYVNCCCDKKYKIPFLLYVCKTDSYRKICKQMQISPSKYTQDNQFIYQLFGLLNGCFCENPKWYFLKRDDSFFMQNSVRLLSIQSDLMISSVNMLSVDDKQKNNLISIYKYDETMESIKRHALFGNTRECFLKIIDLWKLKKNIFISYKIHLPKKELLYLFYSMLKKRKVK